MCFPVADQQQFTDDLNIRDFLHARDAKDLLRQEQETGLLFVSFILWLGQFKHLYAIASFLAVGKKVCSRVHAEEGGYVK